MFRNFINADHAVSEIVGTILMLGIVIIGVSVIGISLISYQGPTGTPNTNVDAWVDEKSNTINIEHVGGSPLDIKDLKILVNIDEKWHIISSKHLRSLYGKDEWSAGDIISINSSDTWREDLSNNYVESTVVHKSSNTMVFNGVLLDSKSKDDKEITKPSGTYADQIILNKPDKGGIIESGGYVTFVNGWGYSFVKMDNTRYNLNTGEFVKLVIDNDQTSGKLDMKISNSQISTFDFDAKLYINGSLKDSGNVNEIYVRDISDYESTLTYKLPSSSGQKYLKVNGNTIIPWSQNNNSAVNVYNIGYYIPGNTVLDFNPSKTYLKCSGYYEIIP